MLRKLKPYIAGILIPLAIGALSALLTRNNMEIYQSIKKPPLSPPSVLFPIVWAILYILMGVGSTRIYLKRDSFDVKPCLWLYAVQLVMNLFWSIIFFNLRVYLFAFIWLCILLILIISMTVCFSRIDKPAAYMQIPYILWVAFAGYLNLFIYILNK